MYISLNVSNFPFFTNNGGQSYYNNVHHTIVSALQIQKAATSALMFNFFILHVSSYNYNYGRMYS